MTVVLAFISAIAELGIFLLELSDRYEVRRRTRTVHGGGEAPASIEDDSTETRE